MLLDDLQTQRLGLGTQRRGLLVLIDDLQTQRLGPGTQRRGLLMDSLYLCSLARQPWLSAALAFL